MRIKFGHLDFAHLVLSDIEKTTPEYSDSESLEEEDLSSTKSFNFPPVVLPDPLRKGILIFRRSGAFYSSHFCLESKTTSIFENLSATLSQKLGDKWSQMSKEGAGYILDNNKNPYISIVSADKGRDRIIAIGSFGATPKKFGTLEDFVLDLKTLEKYTNIIFDACLSPLVKSKEIPELPEYAIYVNS